MISANVQMHICLKEYMEDLKPVELNSYLELDTSFVYWLDENMNLYELFRRLIESELPFYISIRQLNTRHTLIFDDYLYRFHGENTINGENFSFIEFNEKENDKINYYSLMAVI